jgi:hypothetical protein
MSFRILDKCRARIEGDGIDLGRFEVHDRTELVLTLFLYHVTSRVFLE